MDYQKALEKVIEDGTAWQVDPTNPKSLEATLTDCAIIHAQQVEGGIGSYDYGGAPSRDHRPVIQVQSISDIPVVFRNVPACFEAPEAPSYPYKISLCSGEHNGPCRPGQCYTQATIHWKLQATQRTEDGLFAFYEWRDIDYED